MQFVQQRHVVLCMVNCYGATPLIAAWFGDHKVGDHKVSSMVTKQVIKSASLALAANWFKIPLNVITLMHIWSAFRCFWHLFCEKLSHVQMLWVMCPTHSWEIPKTISYDSSWNWAVLEQHVMHRIMTSVLSSGVAKVGHPDQGSFVTSKWSTWNLDTQIFIVEYDGQLSFKTSFISPWISATPLP